MTDVEKEYFTQKSTRQFNIIQALNSLIYMHGGVKKD